MTLKLCERCFTMKKIRGKKIICKRCEEEFDKENRGEKTENESSKY